MNIFSFVQSKRREILRVLLFILSIIFIVLILPREGKFKYEFNKGKPWGHEDLIAPFDFAIQKTDEEVKAEKEEIKSNHTPYFEKDEKAAEKSLENYEKTFHKRWDDSIADISVSSLFNRDKRIKKVKLEHKKTGERLLRKVYREGVVKIHDAIEGKPDDYPIIVLDDNVGKEKSLGELYTVRKAYEGLSRELEAKEVNTDFLLGILEDVLVQNVSYAAETNEKALQQELDNISMTKGMVQKGERIIARGDLVDKEKNRILQSLKTEYQQMLGDSAHGFYLLFGQIILVSLVMLTFFLFLRSFRKEILLDNKRITFLLLLVVAIVLLSNSIVGIEKLNIYLVPFCIIPLIVRTFFDTRLALFTHLVAVLIVGFIAPNPYEFVLIEILAGVIAIFSILSLRNRAQLFISSGLIFLAYSFTYFGVAILQEATFEKINWVYFGWFAGSAMLTLFTYPLIYLFEKVFGFISDVTLMELADTNSKLLRKLNVKAPGSFQHSMQVSTLAEDAIREIGGEALLVRTGALYHDIGKMKNPQYFIENQSTEHNPHHELDYKESAKVIIQHVKDGVEMAKKQNIPEPIIAFIRTHHGTTMTRYFYNMFKKENKDIEVDEEVFRYPGPIPNSKETAVLMMADSVEAASRSLKSYDEETIDNLVENIINHQIEEKQFVNSDITFKDLTTIKKMFKKKLMNIYHVRVEYPDEEK